MVCMTCAYPDIHGFIMHQHKGADVDRADLCIVQPAPFWSHYVRVNLRGKAGVTALQPEA